MNFNRFKSSQKQSSSEFHTLMYRMVFSYTIFLTICLLLIVYLYRTSMKNSEEEFWEQNRSVFQSSQTLMDNHLILMDSYCRELIQNSSFNSTVLMDSTEQSNFYLNAYKTKRSLPAHLYSYSQLPIDFFYIYLHNYGYILSVNKFEAADLYYRHMFKDFPDDYNLWRNAIDSNIDSGAFYTNKKTLADQTIVSYTYMVDLSALTYKNVPATVCFLLKSEELKEIFSGLPIQDSGYLVVTDAQDREILTLSESNQLTAATETIRGLSYNGNFGRFREGAETFVVTKLQSSFNSWNYYLVQPASVCETSYQTYQIGFVFFMVLLAISSIIVILQLSRGHMKPILLLNNRLHETITAHNQLQELVDFQKPYICNSYLRHLMLGNITNEHEINYIRDYLQLQNQQLNFLVFYVTYYNTDDHHIEHPEIDSSELVKAFLLSEFESYTVPYVYSPDDRSYALLLYSTMEPNEMLIALQEKFFYLHERLLDQYSIWIFTGVGLSCNSLKNLWTSYQQAKDMISYSSKNYIFLLYEMKERDSHSFYYPEELSTKLNHFITSSNAMQVIELLHLIHDENLKKRSLPKHILNFLLSDIRSSLIKIRFSVTAPEAATVPLLEEVDILFQDTLTFQLCETIALRLCDIFARQEEPNDLVTSIISYIKKNYHDPALGLNKISDEFHISESYFSHMFKENTGINFSVYLEDIRLNEAIRRIREYECNISDLYLEVGYNNANTFRRAFKKKFGVTPSSVKKSL